MRTCHRQGYLVQYYLPTSPLFSGKFTVLGQVCKAFRETRQVCRLIVASFGFVCIMVVMAAYFCGYYFRSVGLAMLHSRSFI